MHDRRLFSRLSVYIPLGGRDRQLPPTGPKCLTRPTSPQKTQPIARLLKTFLIVLHFGKIALGLIGP